MRSFLSLRAITILFDRLGIISMHNMVCRLVLNLILSNVNILRRMIHIRNRMGIKWMWLWWLIICAKFLIEVVRRLTHGLLVLRN